MSKTVPVVRDKNTRTMSSEHKRIGCLDLTTARGPVHVCEVPGFMTTEITRTSEPPSIGIIAYDVQPGREPGHGYIAQLSPEAAREIAGSLMRMANALDPHGKQ